MIILFGIQMIIIIRLRELNDGGNEVEL